MKNSILKISGILAIGLAMFMNYNVRQSANEGSYISLSGLAAAIASTCESDDGDVCKCSGGCSANSTSCECY
ncbi:hypothetical protein [Marinoscillum furvescens]|uniref:Uncharacterized protein n=1 Tax=Marinoscillum furvescens DSM 4134 TaxID=1122208 RepID=A0A3D9KYR4_MARFU|nr:hypothetical protein [Marinoscillum furvescens]RED94931.1 hypothetical protein C7460_11943 [Marinoscillum furvescens DSM 4134]